MSTLKKVLSKVATRRKLEPTKDITSYKPLIPKLEQNGYVPGIQNGTKFVSQPELEGSSGTEENGNNSAKHQLVDSRKLEAYEEVCFTLEIQLFSPDSCSSLGRLCSTKITVMCQRQR